MADNQTIYGMLQDIHREQISTARTLGEIRTSITDMSQDFKSTKDTVDKHEQAYVVGKFFGIPIVMGTHMVLKGLLQKLGWH